MSQQRIRSGEALPSPAPTRARMAWCRAWLCRGLCAALAITTAWAETEDPPSDESPATAGGPPGDRLIFMQLSYLPSTLLRADFKGADGSVRMYNQDISGALVFFLPNRARLNLALSRDRHSFRFRGNEEVEGLLETAYATRVLAAYFGDLNENWSTVALTSVRTDVESGVSRSDGRMYSGQVLVQRDVGENFQLGVGVLASSRLDTGNLVIPTGMVSWAITDRLRVRTMRGLHLLYKLDEARHWEWGLNAEYHSRYIRLGDAGPAPGGVYRSRAVITTTSLMYRPNPGVTIGFEVGVVPWRELDIRERRGARVWQQRIEPGLSAAALATITF